VILSKIFDYSDQFFMRNSFSTSENLFQYTKTTNSFSTIPTQGVSIDPNEIILVLESDGDFAGLRAMNGFTGKIFSLNRTSLMKTGSNQLTRQNQARLNYSGQF
jgi:hypothetical protein